MKSFYTKFDPSKPITSTENQKPTAEKPTIIISYYALEVFVFNNSDVYNRILNKINKSNLKPSYAELNALKRTATGRQSKANY